MLRASILFVALVAAPILCFYGWRISGRLQAETKRLLVRTLILSLIGAPVPLFGHGFLVLPSVVVLFGALLMILDGGGTGTKELYPLLWTAIAVTLTWGVLLAAGRGIKGLGTFLTKSGTNGGPSGA